MYICALGLSTLVALSGCAPSLVQKPVTRRDYCAANGYMATAIMQQRQAGMSKDEVLGRIRSRPLKDGSDASIHSIAVLLTDIAYQRPIEKTKADRETAVAIFNRETVSACIRGTL